MEGLVDVWVGEGGGMQAGISGQQTVDELNLQLREAEVQLEAEQQRHGKEVAMLQERLQILSSALAASGTPVLAAHSASEAGGAAMCREYVQLVIAGLKKGQETKDVDYRKEIEEQITSLESIARAMDGRLRPVGPDAEIFFDSVLDDDETLLGLMSEIDEGDKRDGFVSKDELFASNFLNVDQNKEIFRIFQTTFEIDLPALEDALSHLGDPDFAEYRRPQRVGDIWGVFDRDASVKAVFDAALEVEATNSKSGPCAAAARLSVGVKKASLEQLAKACRGSEHLAMALKRLASTLLEDSGELDFLAIKRAARRVPRVAGQRMEWVGSMSLDAMLARHLPPGTLFDGLAGVRHMTNWEAQLALVAFMKDARVLFLKALNELRLATGSKSAVEANSKFQGFEGSFASLKDFHAGAEATLNLGYPNPDIMRGILLEHTAHSSANRLYATTNYCIATSLLIEYWWATFEDNPTDATTREKACKQLRKIRSDRSITQPTDASADDGHPLFPGEVADSFVQTLVIVTLTAGDHSAIALKALVEQVDTMAGIKPADKEASKNLFDAAKKAASAVLSDDEEMMARGVTVMLRPECLEWMAASSSIFKTRTQPPTSNTPFELEVKHGVVLVGVVLPMSAARVEACSGLTVIEQKIKDALNQPQQQQQQQLVISAFVAARRTVVFGSYAGVDALRKELGAMSLGELKERAQSLFEGDASQGALAVEAKVERVQLCEKIVAVFVQTDLRADLTTALSNAHECGANFLDSKVDELLRAWGSAPATANQLDRIKIAADLLDSEERWSEVESWVRLYCGRFQGRTRVGLKKLLALRAEQIKLYSLRDGEVLALYIYTGAM